ncbi:MAG: serine protease [Elusimicrobia bacterium]|nr:serine protease [Elusimicrobiota bacterium]
MKKTLSITAGLLAVFITVFIFSTDKLARHTSQFRDAPIDDFGDINIQDINAQNIDLADVPSPTNASLSSGQQMDVKKVVIYGDNTLRDYYLVDKPLQELADSVVAIVRKSSFIFDEKNNTYKPMDIKIIGESKNLKKNADFYKQKILSFCSGSLVSDNLILTAGHCISSDPSDFVYFKDVYIVFGWKQSGKGKYNLSFTADQVYEVDDIVVREKQGDIKNKNTYQDYALVKLNRRVPNKTPLVLDRNGDFLVKGDKVFAISYPSGMSVKITDPNDAEIYEIGKNIFATDLDAFRGSSGAPVFDSYTRRIIGILVTANGQEINYTLTKDIKIAFSISDEITSVKLLRLRKGIFVDENKLIIANDYFATYKEYLLRLRKGIIIDETNGIITFPRGISYFNTEYLYKLIYAIGGKYISKGTLNKLPSFEGLGTGAQRINSIIDAFTPLTEHEIQICDAISSKIRSSGPTNNPNLIMLYKANKCDKSRRI